MSVGLLHFHQGPSTSPQLSGAIEGSTIESGDEPLWIELPGGAVPCVIRGGTSRYIMVAFEVDDVIFSPKSGIVGVSRATVVELVDLYEYMTRTAAIAGMSTMCVAGYPLDGELFLGAQGIAVNFSGASLRGASFCDAFLAGSVFDEADVSDADFSGADLRNASFFEAIAEGASFAGCDLRGAVMSGVSLSSCDTTDCVVDRMTVLPQGYVVVDGRIRTL